MEADKWFFSFIDFENIIMYVSNFDYANKTCNLDLLALKALNG